jgi:hypothetical protein
LLTARDVSRAVLFARGLIFEKRPPAFEQDLANEPRPTTID